MASPLDRIEQVPPSAFESQLFAQAAKRREVLEPGDEVVRVTLRAFPHVVSALLEMTVRRERLPNDARTVRGRFRERVAERPVEPSGGGARINSEGVGEMLPEVLKDVDQARANLARRAKRPQVVPVAPHAPLAP